MICLINEKFVSCKVCPGVEGLAGRLITSNVLLVICKIYPLSFSYLAITCNNTG